MSAPEAQSSRVRCDLCGHPLGDDPTATVRSWDNVRDWTVHLTCAAEYEAER